MASHGSVFVGNIPYQATEKQLIDVCEEIGPVVSFRFILDKKTGKQKGYGFCTYLDEETALSACRNLQGCLVRGRQLRVSLAKHGKCTDIITTNQGQCSSCLGSNLVTAHHPSGTTPEPSQISPSQVQRGSLVGSDLGTAQHASRITPAGVPAMAGAIEGTQSKMISQEDFNRLTNYLARQSKCELQAISSEIKLLAADDSQMVRELVQQNPILMIAQLQADIMLGIATSEMMEMASSQQHLSHIGQMPQQSIPPISEQPATVPMLHQAPACTDSSSQISCSSQVCAESSNGLQIKGESWLARGDCPSMVPWNQASVVQQRVPMTRGMPIQAPTSTDGSQFSYSRRISTAASTPDNLPTEVKSWSELQPMKIRKLACLN